MAEAKIPASIRCNNPGAMWGKGNPIAKKWGATATLGLNDGLGQGNNIAVFPDKVHGAAAQFDLWRTGYCNRTLKAAILKWSGGNWSEPYAAALTRATGIKTSDMVDLPLLASQRGWLLMKAQAGWEAGRPYPMTDTEWQAAQAMCFGTKVPVSSAKKKTAVVTGAVVAAGPVVQAAASHGTHWGIILVGVLGVAFVVAGVLMFLHARRERAVFNHSAEGAS